MNTTPKKTWQRYQIKDSERTGRHRVSPGEESRLYQIQVGHSIFMALKKSGTQYVREKLRNAAIKFLKLPADSSVERILEELGENAVLKIEGSETWKKKKGT